MNRAYTICKQCGQSFPFDGKTLCKQCRPVPWPPEPPDLEDEPKSQFERIKAMNAAGRLMRQAWEDKYGPLIPFPE